MELHVDVERYEHKDEYHTGILVRAIGPDSKWDSYDIAILTKESLFEFLRSRGGENTWAENVVGILLGYGNF